MPETTTNNEVYQPMTFDAIQDRAGFSGEDQRVVSRRGKKAGNNQLQNFKAGEGRPVL